MLKRTTAEKRQANDGEKESSEETELGARASMAMVVLAKDDYDNHCQ